MSSSIYSVTRCGRYGKCHGEPFLRRRSTLEPMETPRRYYQSDSHHEDGKRASERAWKSWKNKVHGEDADVEQSAFFELVDENLRTINKLIWSSNEDKIHHGLEKLEVRIKAAGQADRDLKAAGQRRAGAEETERLLQQTRRGPPVLAKILRDLQANSSDQEAKRKFAQLCDDFAASQTMIGSLPLTTRTAEAPHPSSRHSSSATQRSREPLREPCREPVRRSPSTISTSPTQAIPSGPPPTYVTQAPPRAHDLAYSPSQQQAPAPLRRPARPPPGST